MSSEAETREPRRTEVRARLVEMTPGANGFYYWILSAPVIFFLGWLWVDLVELVSVASRPVGLTLGAATFVALVILPFGYGAHRLVTSFPGLFQRAGWTVHPLAQLRPAEQYTVKYIVVSRERAATDVPRVLLRVAQGWVYLEIAIVLIGALALPPLYLSAIEFGLGR
ncbi:MAG: hypothetical protein OXF62_03740 [Caldilineaceae bacterium]|nr:hypothetical protein [Caldilineaceae bacterium]MCY4117486.1 hypothetical protein [Caldilineaceae bacterium]